MARADIWGGGTLKDKRLLRRESNGKIFFI